MIPEMYVRKHQKYQNNVYFLWRFREMTNFKKEELQEISQQNMWLLRSRSWFYSLLSTA